MNKELKEQVHKEFDERFPCKCKICKLEGVNTFGECFCSYSKSTHIWERPEVIKSFIDSLIDKTVQTCEERVVEFLNQQKAKLDNCNNVDGRVQSECFKRNHRVDDWNEVIDRVISLITNKSDINKLTE